MGEDAGSSMRLLNFVSEEQLEESKRVRGERLEDGTAQRDRPLFEILKENKDKKDAEFNERFKHRPPKALDEDESDFLLHLESSRKQYERHIADEEALQLRSFQAAIEAQSMIVHEVKETPHASTVQEEKRVVGKKSQTVQPLGLIVKVKSKKAKVEPSPDSQMASDEKLYAELQSAGKLTAPNHQEQLKISDGNQHKVHNMTTGLVSYSDESEDD